jgi:hypothetical protein
VTASPPPPADATLVTDSPKMLREALCLAQSAITHWALSGYDRSTVPGHVARIGDLIAQLDRHRPLGPDGKHGDRHTPTCGCEDR